MKRFSPSRLQSWQVCPLQASFKYIDGMTEKVGAKTTFGNIIHKVLESYQETRDIEKAKKQFIEWWTDPSLLGLTIDFWPKGATPSSLREKGLDILKNYHDKSKWDGPGASRVIATEHPFLVQFGDFELTGIVDRLEVRLGKTGKPQLRIVDFKSGNWQPTQLELRTNIQFSAYLYASMQPEFWCGNVSPATPDRDEIIFPALKDGAKLFAEMERIERRGIWFHLSNGKEIDVGDRSDLDFNRLYRLCVEIDKAEEAGVFVPKIGEHCSWCSFTKECGLDIPTRHQAEKELEEAV